MGKEIILSSGSKKLTLSDLDLWEEKQAIKIIEKDRDKIYTVIYADQEVTIGQLTPLINRFHKKGNENIYFAVRNENTFESLNIKLKKIDLNIRLLKNDKTKLND